MAASIDLRILTSVFLILSILDVSHAWKFNINYTDDSFYMDGKPFRYVSGSLHYFRIPREYWQDRLRKVRAAGLNAISTYVEWSQHEAKPGVFDFSGDLDLWHFIRLAQDEDLYVILRPGPYICAERDMGGLPFWLLEKHPRMNLRTRDPDYTRYVDRWLNRLMSDIGPLLYGRGGPIILVQVENEYGSYAACDHSHLEHIRDLFESHVHGDAVLFTTDGASARLLQCGKIPGVYATVDFGPGTDVRKAFEVMRKFEPRGPLVNSEFYPGWLTHWGEKMAHVETAKVTQTLKEMLDVGANVNFYMFHGGTNFGFTAGANFGSHYASDITSYDYDAPISEAGDLTEKYYAIKRVLANYLPGSGYITVETSPKGDYGEVQLTPLGKLFSPMVRDLLGVTRRTYRPMSFESVSQNVGYILYETLIDSNYPNGTKLHIPVIHDHAVVYVNEEFCGHLSRQFHMNDLPLGNISRGDRLGIVVENLGRINYGPLLNDTKGILSDVYIGNTPLVNWNMTSFELTSPDPLRACRNRNRRELCMNGAGFTFYVGTFRTPGPSSGRHPLDTFLDTSPLFKGVVFVNGRNLGRYWPRMGPQISLYVPGAYLDRMNEIVVMDEYITPPSLRLRFTKKPIAPSKGQ